MTEKIDPTTGEVLTIDDSPVPMVRKRIRSVFLNARGQEIPDPTPIAPPIGYKRQPSLFETLREQISNEMRLQASDREFETFEENDDFDIPDDPLDPHSPWENDFDPPFSEVRQAIEETRREKAEKAAREAETLDPVPSSESRLERAERAPKAPEGLPAGTAEGGSRSVAEGRPPAARKRSR